MAEFERSIREVFTDIYTKQLWGGKDGGFFSGPGSRGAAAELYINTVNDFIRRRAVKSVLDIGCGDYMIGQRIACEKYIGIDVVEEVIARNKQEYGSDSRAFFIMDAVNAEMLPEADLCLVRQVFQHLSNAQVLTTLQKLQKFRFLLVTEHQPNERDFTSHNIDIVHGPDTRLRYGSGVYLDKPPFNAKAELLAEHRGSNAAAEVHDRGSIRTFLIKVPQY